MYFLVLAMIHTTYTVKQRSRMDRKVVAKRYVNVKSSFGGVLRMDLRAIYRRTLSVTMKVMRRNRV